MCRIAVLTAIVSMTLVVAGPTNAQSPSFDCARASTPTERTICASPELARQDQTIAALFADLRAHAGQQVFRRVLKEQRAWLARRNSCGGSQRCISDAGADRIYQLEARSREVFGGQ